MGVILARFASVVDVWVCNWCQTTNEAKDARCASCSQPKGSSPG